MPAPPPDPNPLITLFRRCVVRVDDDAGGFLGSGFFVAHGTVLTCAHVVQGAPELLVTWEGTVVRATVAEVAGDPAADLAVLVLEAAPEGHPCARLGAVTALGEPLYIAGHTKGEHAAGVVGFTGAGTELETPIAEGDITFHKLAGGQVLPGFSGAPLLNLHSADVCGGGRQHPRPPFRSGWLRRAGGSGDRQFPGTRRRQRSISCRRPALAGGGRG